MSTTGGKKTIKNTNIWRLNNTLLNNKSWKKPKSKSKYARSKGRWKHNNPKSKEFSKSSAKGKVHNNTSLPQETRINQINNLTLHLNQLEKEEMKNYRDSIRKEIIKITAQINEKRNKSI